MEEDDNAIGDVLCESHDGCTDIANLGELAAYTSRSTTLSIPIIASELCFSKIRSNSAPLGARSTGIFSRFEGDILCPHERVMILEGSR